MKASKLISELFRLIDQHGDLEIRYCNDPLDAKSKQHSDLCEVEVKGLVHRSAVNPKAIVIRLRKQKENANI